MKATVFMLVFLTLLCSEGCDWAGGATFPVPVYESVWNLLHSQSPGTFPYTGVGSEKGVKSFLKRSYLFAGSDWPLTPAEEALLVSQSNLASAPPHVYIPTVVGAVVPIYNIGAVSAPLNFTAESLAGIYNGTIRTWNAIGSNEGVVLPSRPIKVVCREDGSGSTYIWTEFLSIRSTSWHVKPGLRVKWPVCDVKASGSEGMVSTVLGTPDSIGYVEFTYAVQNTTTNVSYGQVENRAKQFKAPDVDSISAATVSVDKSIEKNHPPDADIPRASQIAILETEELDAYPISATTWLLVPLQPPAQHTGEMMQFLNCLVSPKVQQKSKQNIYAPLPQSLIDFAHRQVTRIAAPAVPIPPC